MINAAVASGRFVLCGCIWTPPFCNALVRAGLASRLLTYIRLLNAARSIAAASACHEIRCLPVSGASSGVTLSLGLLPSRTIFLIGPLNEFFKCHSETSEKSLSRKA